MLFLLWWFATSGWRLPGLICRDLPCCRAGSAPLILPLARGVWGTRQSDFSAFFVAEGEIGKRCWRTERLGLLRASWWTGWWGRSSSPCVAACFGAKEAVSLQELWITLDNRNDGRRLHFSQFRLWMQRERGEGKLPATGSAARPART